MLCADARIQVSAFWEGRDIMAIELPLFPLNVVLFPGAELPLHIFEPRYRLMINECYDE